MLGVDYLAGAKYQRLVLRNHPAGWAAGVFSHTFGRGGLRLVRKLAASGKCPLIRVNLHWDDNHRYGGRRQMRKIKKRAKRVEAIAREYPRVKFEIAPFTEHNLSNPDMYLSQIAAITPNCRVVNSVWRGALSRRYKNEVHGHHAKPDRGPYNYSFDGTDAWDSDVTRLIEKHENAEVFFFWTHVLNLKKGEKDRTKRPFRLVRPTKAQLKSLIFLATEKGATSIPCKYTWKTHADQHGSKARGRESKPVLISPKHLTNVKLKAGGRVIASLAPSGKSDGMYLYRASTYGYLLANEARRLTGNPVCQLVAGGKVIANVNPAFRIGSYRIEGKTVFPKGCR